MTEKKDQLTTILKTGNQATITFAKSLLEDAGIKGIIWDFRTIGEVDLGQVEDTYSEEIGDESNE